MKERPAVGLPPNQLMTTLTKKLLLVFLVFLFILGSTEKTSAEENLRINEVMVYPAGNNPNLRWLEIYNPSNKEITLVGGSDKNSWLITDDSGIHFIAKEALLGSLKLPPNSFLILANDAETFLKTYPHFNGNLVNTVLGFKNNFGFIALKDPSGKIISQAVWSPNLGAQGNNKTLEHTKGIFRESLRDFGSPGQENSVEGLILPPAPSLIPSSPPITTKTPSPWPSPVVKIPALIINEVFYNPDKNRQAWVEIKNLENKEISLDGFRIFEANHNHSTTLSGKISANALQVIKVDGLNRKNEILQIFNAENKKVFEVKYQSPIPENWSAARFSDGSWKITSRTTPEKENIYFLPQEISQELVPQELIPELNFESSSKNIVQTEPPNSSYLLLKGIFISLLLTLIFTFFRKKLII